MKISKEAMVVLKAKMFTGFNRLTRNVQTGGAAGKATTSDSRGTHVASRKRVTFASSAKGGDELSGSS